MSVDFEKAFNRMDHNACLDSLTRLGASEADTELVACFLRQRTMSIKVGSEFSQPRTVPGGSPQGSILGNFLFCATTDEFTTGTAAAEEYEGGANNHREEISDEQGNQNRTPDMRGDEDSVEEDKDDPHAQAEESFDSHANDTDESFCFFRPRRPNRLEDTETSIRYTQDELDAALGIPKNWERTPAQVLAYIDDLNVIEKVRHIDAVSIISNKKQKSLAHAPSSETFFKHVSLRASELNMRVNEEKTQVLCVSAARTSDVESYINANTQRINSGSCLKILGFWFNTDPTVEMQVSMMETKIRKRLWALRHLRRSGMGASDLTFVYKTIIRPVLDFASSTYHPMLNQQQSDRLESLQRRAVKIIYGIHKRYSEITDKGLIERLDTRREEMFEKFAIRASKNPRFADIWFPRAEPNHYDLRLQPKYAELHARTNRLLNSPLFRMRKILNALEQ